MSAAPDILIRQLDREDRVVAVTVLHDAMDALLNVDAHMNERTEAAALLAGAMGHSWPPYPVDEEGEHREDWPCRCHPEPKPVSDGRCTFLDEDGDFRCLRWPGHDGSHVLHVRGGGLRVVDGDAP